MRKGGGAVTRRRRGRRRRNFFICFGSGGCVILFVILSDGVLSCVGMTSSDWLRRVVLPHTSTLVRTRRVAPCLGFRVKIRVDALGLTRSRWSTYYAPKVSTFYEPDEE